MPYKFNPFTGQLDTVIGGIDDLSDVDTSTVAPTGGQSLVWNDTNSRWEPASGGGGITRAQATAITLLFN